MPPGQLTGGLFALNTDHLSEEELSDKQSRLNVATTGHKLPVQISHGREQKPVFLSEAKWKD